MTWCRRYPHWVTTSILLYIVRKGRIPEVQVNSRVKVVVLYTLHSVYLIPVDSIIGLMSHIVARSINNTSKNSNNEQN